MGKGAPPTGSAAPAVVGGRHRLGVDTLDLGDIGEIYGIFTGDVGEIHCLGVDALPRPLTCFAASRFTGDIREIYGRYTGDIAPLTCFEL